MAQRSSVLWKTGLGILGILRFGSWVCGASGLLAFFGALMTLQKAGPISTIMGGVSCLCIGIFATLELGVTRLVLGTADMTEGKTDPPGATATPVAIAFRGFGCLALVLGLVLLALGAWLLYSGLADMHPPRGFRR